MNPPPSCPICSSTTISVSDTLSGAQIRQLWAALDNQIGESAYGSISKDTEVNLHLCDPCGFRFYNPEFAGSAEFYEDLMTKKTYPLGGPEFDHAINFAGRHGITRVLDVGGGEGAFLDLARKSGLETLGVELNRNASEVSAGKGHRMFNKPMEDIDLAELDGGAEMLTLFQVVEHVSAPVEFVTSAARLVRPGGYINIAVPSDRRMLGLLKHDPADWPPHHVSRWRINDLKEIGVRSGLEVVECQADLLTGSAILWALRLHNKLEAALGNRQHIVPTGIASILSLVYRALKLKHVLPFHGLSLHIVLRKPLS
jgi:SAM-dependent methyltransferase